MGCIVWNRPDSFNYKNRLTENLEKEAQQHTRNQKWRTVIWDCWNIMKKWMKTTMFFIPRTIFCFEMILRRLTNYFRSFKMKINRYLLYWMLWKLVWETKPIHLFLVLFIHLTIKHVLRKIIDTLCTKRPKIFRFILIETQTKHFDTRLQLP